MTSIPDNINRMYGIPTTSENVVDKPWTYAGAKVRVYRNKDKSGYVKESMSDILKPKQFDVNSSLNSNISGYGLRIGNSALIYFDNFQDAIRFYQQFFCIFPKSK